MTKISNSPLNIHPVTLPSNRNILFKFVTVLHMKLGCIYGLAIINHHLQNLGYSALCKISLKKDFSNSVQELFNNT